MDVCAAAGPDGMPVLRVSGLMRSIAGDGGKGREGSPGIYASPCDLRPHPVRCTLLWHGQACFHPQERGERRRRRVEAADCRYGSASILVLHKALPFAADNLLPHQVSTVAAAGTDILVHGFRERLEQFGRDPDKVALRVDASNALNAAPRDEILEESTSMLLGSAFCSRHMWWATLRGVWQDSAVFAPGNAAGGFFGDAAICSGYTTSYPPCSVRM
jgi:hypothetical protein